MQIKRQRNSWGVKHFNKDTRVIPQFCLSTLSDYRTELMGISSIGVIACHACQHCELPSILYKVLSLGNECVDIFLFLGGMGMFFSLRKIHEKHSGGGYRRMV